MCSLGHTFTPVILGELRANRNAGTGQDVHDDVASQ